MIHVKENLLYKIIEDGIIDLRKHKELKTRTYREGEYGVRAIFEYKADRVNVDRKQYKKVVGIINEYDKVINELDETKDSYHEEKQNEFETCIDKLKNIAINRSTKIYRFITTTLFSGYFELYKWAI